MINLGMCGNKIVLHIARGGIVGSVLVHVSFVGSGQAGQVVIDQCWSETRDGGELFTAIECHEECY